MTATMIELLTMLGFLTGVVIGEWAEHRERLRAIDEAQADEDVAFFRSLRGIFRDAPLGESTGTGAS